MTSRKRILQAPAWICLAAVLAAFALYRLDPLPLQALRHGVFDQYQRWSPLQSADSGVRVVDLDEQSLARLGQWPWPRTRLAELVARLQRAGAAAIVFDVLFAEPDRTSPQRLADGLPADLATALRGLPDHDQVFARRLADGRVVLGFAALNQAGLDQDGDKPVTLPPARFGLLVRGSSPLPFLPRFDGATTALPALAEAAAGNGALTFNPDSDGVVRRVPLFVALGGQVRPSLVAEALRVAGGARQYLLDVGKSGIRGVDIGPLHLPTTDRGELWLHYRLPAPERVVPAWRLFDEPASADTLRGAMVLVGSSAQGLQDLRFSPLGGIIPGVDVHAQALEQALAGDYLRRPAWAGALEALAGGALLCLLTLRNRALVSAFVGAALLLGVNLLAWRLFLHQRLLLDAFTPTLCLVAVFVVAGIVRHVATEREQRWVRQAFSRYVSPNLVQHLVEHHDQLALGGERRTCSFVFTDLAGFTGLLERQPPEAMVSLLNGYLEQMVRIAFRHDGTLDRIVGDAVAVMFSAPLPQADHEARALACALEMHAFARRYAQDLAARGTPFGDTRIGVHSGEVVVGNFGGATLFDYRALGDPVNTAARLEGLNRTLGTLLCVSGAIRQACPHAPMRPVGEVLLKGKQEAVAVYQPLASAPGLEQAERDDDYQAAYDLLAGDRLAALDAFERLHAQRPEDGLPAFHLSRLRSGEQGVRFSAGK